MGISVGVEKGVLLEGKMKTARQNWILNIYQFLRVCVNFGFFFSWFYSMWSCLYDWKVQFLMYFQGGLAVAAGKWGSGWLSGGTAGSV